MNKKFIVATAFFAQLAAGAALACGEDTEAKWNSPPPDAPAISIKDAQEKLKTEKHVIVQKSALQSMCGPATFFVVDAEDNQYLGEFPAPDQDDDGRTIIARTEQITSSVTKAVFASLKKAEEDFRNDSDALEEEFGVYVYDPEARALSQRFPGSKKQHVEVNAEFCKMVETATGPKSYSTSLQALSENTPINTYRFIPGRIDYSEATIYHKGDLQKELLGNPQLRTALEERAARNARDCQPRPSDNGINKWKGITNRLTSESTPELLRSPFERYTQKFGNAPDLKIESAVLVNNNSLRIIFTENSTQIKQIISGDADGILRIEQDLARKQIKTDRNSGLDMKGKMAKETHHLNAPLPVVP